MHIKGILIVFLCLFCCGAIYTPRWDVGLSIEGYITLGTMGSFGSQLDDGYWTFSFWVAAASTDLMSLVGCQEGGKGEIAVNLNATSTGTKSTGRLQIYIADADGQTLKGGVNSDTGIADGNWHHICVQISCAADTIRFFVDGVRLKTSYATQQDVDHTLDYASRAVYLLAYNNNGTTERVYGGYSAEFAFFNAELSTQQIQALAAKKRTAFQVGTPYAYWRMNEYTDGQDLDGVTIVDFSGNGRNGTGVDQFNSSGDNIHGVTDSFTY